MKLSKKLVTAKEYIEKTSIPRATFFDRLKKGKIPYFRIGKSKKKWFDLNGYAK